jgi:hypothetical protein
MTTRFCPRCKRNVTVHWGSSTLHTCERVARSDDETQPIRVGELAGPRDPGLMSGPPSEEEPAC